MIQRHKVFMQNHFEDLEKPIFSEEGYSKCPVMGTEHTLESFRLGDTTIRTEPGALDIVMGHCEPRSNTRFTIRGLNITLMTRRGQLLDWRACSHGK